MLGIIPAIGKQQLYKGLNNRSNPLKWASQVVRNLPANAGDVRDVGSIPGSGRSPGGGHGNPLQYPGLENPMDRGAWRGCSARGHRESDTTEPVVLGDVLCPSLF